MSLPDFLKEQPVPDLSPEFTGALNRYKEHFGCGVSTAELVMPKEDIIDMIDLCVAEDKTWQEYLGHPGYDDDTDY